MDHFMYILNLFPREMRESVLEGISELGKVPEEVRLRIGRKMWLRSCGKELQCGSELTKEQMVKIVGNAADGSYHTAVRHIREGYIPLQGGSRMGVCGSGKNGEIASFMDIHSACIRIASCALGCADELYESLYGEACPNTIVIAPPGAGKTTVLRELVRKLSYGGAYVGVADERGEIAGVYQDRPSFDLGPRCDVLTGISKSKGAMMLLRSMTPNVIAMDEITAYSDMEAIMEAVGCGAALLTSIHGTGLDALRKPAFRGLYDAMVFEKAVLIEVSEGGRRYREVDLYSEAYGSCDDRFRRGDSWGDSTIGNAG